MSDSFESEKFRDRERPAGAPRAVELEQELQSLLTLQAEFRPRKDKVRSSNMACFRECPRKYMFRYRLGLAKQGYRSAALEVGTIFHEMCQHCYEGKTAEESVRLASQSLTARQEELKKLVNDQGLLPDATPIEKVIAEDESNFALAQVVFQYSYPQFFNAPFLKEWKVIAVETPIELEFTGIAAPLRCKPDVILLRPEDNSLMIVNHKTTGKSCSKTAATYRLDLQPQLERMLVQAAFPEYTVRFYLHNIVRKPTLRYPAKKYPTFESYLTACKAWYEEQKLKTPDDPPFLVSLMALPKNPTSEELFIRLREAAAAANSALSHARFYCDSNACMGKFGNQPCPYLELCTSSVVDWPSLIRGRFDQKFREDEETQEEEQ